jgi:hypothetical protein
MFRLKHNDIEPRDEVTSQDRAERAGRMRRLGGWLRRRLGRERIAGLWTLSPDGKLDCESWPAEGGRPD